MCKTSYKVILCCIFLIRGSEADRVVSDELQDERSLRKDRNTYRVNDQRRAMDEADDREWHVSHLRDIDFDQRRSGCKQETFEEKIMRYRKSLQNDAALVKYVSADQLPVDKEGKKGNVCLMPEAIDRIFKPTNKSEVKVKEHNSKKVNVEDANKKEEVKDSYYKAEVKDSDKKKEVKDSDKKEEVMNSDKKKEVKDSDKKKEVKDGDKKEEVKNSDKKEEVKDSDKKAEVKESDNKEEVKHSDKKEKVDTATTHHDAKAGDEAQDLRRRPGEYQFSSVEYYDEVPTLDAHSCPDTVLEIVLELEHIRNYDIQCELIIEWKSLE